MKRWFVFVCFTSLPLAGQTQQISFLKLENGARVGYEIWSGIESRPGQKSVSMAEANGNAIRRTLFNQDGTPWLGFEVHIDKSGDSDFRISFAPVAGFPYFAQGPLPRQIHDGDRVMMDVLEQPGTGKKVFDMFQVYLKTAPHTLLPTPTESIPSLIPPGTALRLAHPVFTLKGTHVRSVQESTVSAGSPVSIDVPPVGRFSFSSAPLSGYLLEAVAAGGKIEVAGDVRYTVTCDSPIVDVPGSWFLWVRFEPNANVAPPMPAAGGPPPLEVTATPAEMGSDPPVSGVLLTIKNTSNKNVLAYAIQLQYTNPNTGERMGSGAHAAFKQPLDGTPNYLRPGQVETSPKPTSLPRDSYGTTARYTISVDLVVFEDGSRWGPATSRAATQLLQRVQASGLIRR